jgi:hypothetical protein
MRTSVELLQRDHEASHGIVSPGLPSILTLREVSQELRCSKAHLSHIINGKVAGLPPLPVARIGRRIIIRRAVLMHWLWIIERHDGIMDSDLSSSLETHGKE